MSFHFAVFSAERNARELQKYLSYAVKPLCLQHLYHLDVSDHDSILAYTRDLAVRTAHSYAAFFDPVVQHCLDKVPRLPWAKEVSLREFQFCVQLQEVAEQYVWEKKQFLGTDSFLKGPTDTGRETAGELSNGFRERAGGGVSAASALRCVLQDQQVAPMHSTAPFYPFHKGGNGTPSTSTPVVASSSFSFSEKDPEPNGPPSASVQDSPHEETPPAGTEPAPRLSTTTTSSTSSTSMTQDVPPPPSPTPRTDEPSSSTSSGPLLITRYPVDGKEHDDVSHLRHSSSFRCRTYASPTRDRIVHALQRGEITLSTLPFETALALLRPEQSLLHILVNETRIDSLPLNVWFSHFCQRRVAWRVLHEHLLHVLQPLVFPHVIVKGVDVLDLVYHAADVVTGIHASQPITTPDESLHLSAALRKDLVQQVPSFPFLTSSHGGEVMAAGETEREAGCDGGGAAAAAAASLSSARRRRRTMPERAAHPSVMTPMSSPSLSDVGPSLSSSSSPPPPPPSPSPVIYAVDSHLKYVFRELLKNAYMATASVHPRINIDIQASQDREWVTIDIVDQGHGIAEEDRQNIWRFGFTKARNAENTALAGFGVGLPTSKVYMDLWGGRMDVYSSAGEGTTVRVQYPTSPTEQLAPDHPEYWPLRTIGRRSEILPHEIKQWKN